ncbi:MAG: hypothetical protein V3U39_12085 [Acidimicrobiia bacterium]
MSIELGKGACGTVFRGIRKEDQRQVAMLPGSVNNVMKEVRLLEETDHPCMVQLEEMIRTSDTWCLILEPAIGRELVNKIIEKTRPNQLFN